ncbi:MAG TPA: hypothetical protein VIP11_13475 [Gemmatimonadaceae bacterium]
MVMRSGQARRMVAKNAAVVSSMVLERVRRHVSNAMETVRWLVAAVLTGRDTALLPSRHVTLASLAAAATLDHAWLARTRRQRLVCVAYGDCPVRADPERVRWILDNLLSLATETSLPEARIQLVVAMRQADGRTWSTATVVGRSPTQAQISRLRQPRGRSRALALDGAPTRTAAPLSANRALARLMEGNLTIDPATEYASMSVTLWLPPDKPNVRHTQA